LKKKRGGERRCLVRRFEKKTSTVHKELFKRRKEKKRNGPIWQAVSERGSTKKLRPGSRKKGSRRAQGGAKI